MNNYSIYSYDYCFDNFDKIYHSTGDDEFRKELLQYTPTTSAKYNLAGDIEKEFYLEDVSFIQRLEEMLVQHFNTFDNQNISKVTIIDSNNNGPWINYMGPNEFNPPHNHPGILGFVWYLDIPEEIREEVKKFDGASEGKRGCIQFFSQIVAKQDMTFNPKTNDLLLFSAKHSHQVYPFRSNNTRVSLAGNIYDYK